MKTAIVGGGSLFVVSILHGLERHASALRRAGAELLLSLYDIAPERARRVAQYAEMAARAWELPLVAEVCRDRTNALADAELVIESVGLWEAQAFGEQMIERFCLPRHSIHDGPPSFAIAAHQLSFFAELGEQVRQVAPEALLVVLTNPTEVMADVVERATGVRCCGMCVEVDQLGDYLAYYLNLPIDSIDLVCAGVNHDGWVLRFEVDGRDGYEEYREQLLALPARPDFHPGNLGMITIFRATGHLRSSAFHNWPWEVRGPDDPEAWERFRLPPGAREEAVKQALEAREPIPDPPGTHPEHRRLFFPGLGRGMGDLMVAIATGEPRTVALQLRNMGSVSNFPGEVMVEVPVVAAGKQLRRVAVGELPEWLGGTTRLLALQRKLAADYLLEPRLDTLLQALVTVPTVAVMDDLAAFAQELHAWVVENR